MFVIQVNLKVSWSGRIGLQSDVTKEQRRVMAQEARQAQHLSGYPVGLT